MPKDKEAQSVQGNEQDIKRMVQKAIENTLEEYRARMAHLLLQMAPTTDDVVGECDVCHALVQAKHLKKVPMVQHDQVYSLKDQWLFMCCVCAKTLEDKGGISRVTVRYDETYSTAPRETAIIEKQLDKAGEEVKQ
jgi:hypothetical protein